MKTEKRPALIGRLIGSILSLVFGYYCMSKITVVILPKNTSGGVYAILNILLTILYISVNRIYYELVKIRKVLEK